MARSITLAEQIKVHDILKVVLVKSGSGWVYQGKNSDRSVAEDAAVKAGDVEKIRLELFGPFPVSVEDQILQLINEISAIRSQVRGLSDKIPQNAALTAIVERFSTFEARLAAVLIRVEFFDNRLRFIEALPVIKRDFEKLAGQEVEP